MREAAQQRDTASGRLGLIDQIQRYAERVGGDLRPRRRLAERAAPGQHELARTSHQVEDHAQAQRHGFDQRVEDIERRGVKTQAVDRTGRVGAVVRAALTGEQWQHGQAVRSGRAGQQGVIETGAVPWDFSSGKGGC